MFNKHYHALLALPEVLQGKWTVDFKVPGEQEPQPGKDRWEFPGVQVNVQETASADPDFTQNSPVGSSPLEILREQKRHTVGRRSSKEVVQREM